jgi:hypothetical protein
MGVVSEVRDSKYNSGRGNDRVKKTCAQRETLTTAGFALDGNDWDGIYLSRRKGNDLIYAGKVDHGFDKTSAAILRKRLTPLIRKTQPYAKRIAHWVEPELLERRGRCDILSSADCARTCSRLLVRLFCWRYFTIKPILLFNQREPCRFHALVPFMRCVISRTFGKLSAVLRILSEVVRLFHGVLLCE